MAEFPLLERKVHGHSIVYLDGAASSQKPSRVLDAMRDFEEKSYSNVHRGVHTLAEEATERFEKAREAVAKFINASSEETIFTSGTTESLNMVARMLTQTCEPGDEIVITMMEHHSNFVPWQQLAEREDLKLNIVPITPEYELDMDAAREMINENTKIVACIHVSNVLGTIVQVKELARLAHSNGALMVVDGAQAVAHMPVDVKALDADFYAFSGHKMYGPTGIGVLYGRKELLEKLEPVSWGGEMVKDVKVERTTWNDLPWKFEPGTPRITQAIGLHEAINFIHDKTFKRIQEHEQEILEYALEQLSSISQLTIIGPIHAKNRGGAISFTLADVHPHDIATVLDSEGVAVRAGHHCAQPLHCALGLDSTTRASLSIHNTEEDIDRLVKGLEKVKEVLS